MPVVISPLETLRFKSRIAMKPVHIGICKIDVSNCENHSIRITYLLLINEVLDVVPDDSWVNHVRQTGLQQWVVWVSLARTVTQPEVCILGKV
jgi:hypothetical protein